MSATAASTGTAPDTSPTSSPASTHSLLAFGCFRPHVRH
jgi:hypothetical protein